MRKLTASLTFIKQCAMFLMLMMCVSVIYATETPTKAYFLTLADVHFDPYDICRSRIPCAPLQQLIKAPISDWPEIFKKNEVNFPGYRQNTNYLLLQSALLAAEKESSTHQAQFVLVLGDLLAHHFRGNYRLYSGDKSQNGYQNFTHKTLQFIAAQFKQTFPDKDVYFVVGNNDSYHGDYRIIPNGSFFHDMAVDWSSLFKADSAEMKATFQQAGYYSVDMQNDKDLRLIVLNTVLFSYKAKGKGVQEAAEKQLSWLHQQLMNAKEQHKKILLVMHIPIGIDIYITSYLRLVRLKELWHRKYIERFDAEMALFPNQIMGVIAGHLHSDWFEVLKFADTNGEIPMTGVPSISPVYGNNPGFKVYSFNPQTLTLENFVTYYFALKRNHTWTMQYDFNRTYQPHCTDCSMLRGMKVAKH